MGFSSGHHGNALQKIVDAINGVLDTIEDLKNQGGRLDRTELEAIKDYAGRLESCVLTYGRPSSELVRESRRLFETARILRGHSESRLKKLGIKLTILCSPIMIAMVEEMPA